MKRARYAVLMAALALGVFVGPVQAAPEPVFVPGNPSCAGALIEPVESGTYSVDFDGFTGTITITVNEDGTFDFVTDSPSHLVTSVLVKGGPNANLYTYPAPGVSSDTGLHAPVNLKNGKFYGLSHLCFDTSKV
jgi:hypothetical protein